MPPPQRGHFLRTRLRNLTKVTSEPSCKQVPPPRGTRTWRHTARLRVDTCALAACFAPTGYMGRSIGRSASSNDISLFTFTFHGHFGRRGKLPLPGGSTGFASPRLRSAMLSRL